MSKQNNKAFLAVAYVVSIVLMLVGVITHDGMLLDYAIWALLGGFVAFTLTQEGE